MKLVHSELDLGVFKLFGLTRQGLQKFRGRTFCEQFLPRDAVLARYMLSSVRPSVRPSQAGTVPKRLNIDHENKVIQWPMTTGTKHITGTVAGRVVTSIVSDAVNLGEDQCDKLMTVVCHQFITLTVRICVQRRAGLSAAAETCSGSSGHFPASSFIVARTEGRLLNSAK